jgi:hypothetical protein
MQLSFSTLWDGFRTDKDAMKERNERAKGLREEGIEVRCWTLPNQMRDYKSYGVVDGRVCNVYKIDVIS